MLTESAAIGLAGMRILYGRPVGLLDGLARLVQVTRSFVGLIAAPKADKLVAPGRPVPVP